MCGIFGFSFTCVNPELQAGKMLHKLLELSRTRGKDASGIAFLMNDEIKVLKRAIDANHLIKTKEFKSIEDEIYKHCQNSSSAFSIIGHSRMVTNGMRENHLNNQPVIKKGKVVIHNGIIVNESELWSLTGGKRELEVDTETIPEVFDFFKSQNLSFEESLINTYKTIKGTASIAMLFDNYNALLLASNNGSLYFIHSEDKKFLLFASEFYMLDLFKKAFSQFEKYDIIQVKPNKGFLFNTDDAILTEIDLNHVQSLHAIAEKSLRKITDINHIKDSNKPHVITKKEANYNLLEYNIHKTSKLKRCTKCLLPETFPFISYDQEGVCNMCHDHKKITFKGLEALKTDINPHRKIDKVDVIVPVSGGRDSCYSLHYIKKELGLNPLAFTYDWGMVTDLARRNISRMCSQLGIEHILISADITQKRKNIQKNVAAWLKQPHLGTIPLFMAGDKQYFYYLNQVCNQNKVHVAIYGENPYEKTNFKTGFCGINEGKSRVYYDISIWKKLQLGLFYGKEFITNPKYLNSSLIDTFGAFLSAYFLDHDEYLFLYQYIPWNEEIINNTLINTYGWELSPDTKTTWRIGDGTASFYNYIYYTVAGFTENDTLRSNQIREGFISREEALSMVHEENRPRFESIKWYLDTIGLDFDSTIKRINEIPKLYR